MESGTQGGHKQFHVVLCDVKVITYADIEVSIRVRDGGYRKLEGEIQASLGEKEGSNTHALSH
jgi:hypothetical protein